jgi:Peptidase M15
MCLSVFKCLGLGVFIGLASADAGAGGLNPKLRVALAQIHAHYGRPVEITSGCRSSASNRRAGGRKGSLHLRCMAADIRVPGVGEGQLLAYVKRMPIVGGVGTYCGNSIVHIDVGPKRRWGSGCGKRRHALKGVRKVLLARR